MLYTLGVSVGWVQSCVSHEPAALVHSGVKSHFLQLFNNCTRLIGCQVGH